VAVGVRLGIWFNASKMADLLRRIDAILRQYRDKLDEANAALLNERSRTDEERRRSDKLLAELREKPMPIVLEEIDILKEASPEETIGTFNTFVVKRFRFSEARKRKRATQLSGVTHAR